MTIDCETSLVINADRAICEITLNRPPARNAWNARMGDEFALALNEAEGDDAVKVARGCSHIRACA